jgi:beta-mannosidase
MLRADARFGSASLTPLQEHDVNQQLSTWRIVDVDPGNPRASDRAFGLGDGWIASTAPGDTYLALIAAGRLEHPFAGRNEAAADWVRHREWWWHTQITIDAAAAADALELVFDGLDTFADIYLDGTWIGSSDNMFRQLRLALAPVAAGAHHIAVRFSPTAAVVGERPLQAWKNLNIFIQERRPLMRKAQFGWGWDFGPSLPTVGIWKPVRIESAGAGSAPKLNFTTLSIDGDTATARVDVEWAGAGDVAVELLAPDGTLAASGVRKGAGSLSLTIARPLLWWTVGLGAQPLYTLVARTAAGPEQRQLVGIRTLAIDESPDPDEPGTLFRFVLNGVPIFSKGACWIPVSSFVGAVTPQTYTDYVLRAAAANMNMIRIWGGGVYEHDAFYDACDAAGVLVWQDFMFACAIYPEDEAFLASVRAEVTEQVQRLRTHPCIAVWCGNNENEVLNQFENMLNRTNDPLPGGAIFDRHIPELLRELDPCTPYRPSSPWGGRTPNSMRVGDVHNWSVWHGAALMDEEMPMGPMFGKTAEDIAYTHYADDKARFVSEFGIQAAPELATLKRWMAADDIVLGSQGFLDRAKDHGDKANLMTSLVTGRAASVEEFVDFTMLTQAEGLKFGIEHFRRRMPHCSGTLIWQFNDCWPGISWSLIDHDGVAKASYYVVKKAYAPVLASFRRGADDAVELWITSDQLTPIADTASVVLVDFNGEEHWRTDVAFEVGANTSAIVWRGTVQDAVDRVLTVDSASGKFPANRLLLAAPKDLALAPNPGLEWKADGARLTVTAASYALSVRIATGDPTIRFDDNYFDLAAGQSRTVVANGAIDPSAIEVTSWADRRASRS